MRERLVKRVATNELTFSVEEYVDMPTRHRWGDTSSISIEEKIKDLVIELPTMAEACRARRLKWEAETQRYDAKVEERLRDQRSKEAQRLLRAKLVETMSRWEQANRIYRFCEAVKFEADRKGEGSRPAISEWLTWSKTQADLLNPLSADLSHFTSLQADVPDWFTGDDHGKAATDWWSSCGNGSDCE